MAENNTGIDHSVFKANDHQVPHYVQLAENGNFIEEPLHHEMHPQEEWPQGLGCTSCIMLWSPKWDGGTNRNEPFPNHLPFDFSPSPIAFHHQVSVEEAGVLDCDYFRYDSGENWILGNSASLCENIQEETAQSITCKSQILDSQAQRYDQIHEGHDYPRGVDDGRKPFHGYHVSVIAPVFSAGPRGIKTIKEILQDLGLFEHARMFYGNFEVNHDVPSIKAEFFRTNSDIMDKVD